MAKLTQDQKQQVINRRNNGESVTALAKEYGVTPAAISQLVKRANKNIKKVNTEGLANISQNDLETALRILGK